MFKSKIQKELAIMRNNKTSQIRRHHAISNILSKALKISPIDLDHARVKLKSYDIIQEHRIHDSLWVNVLEIVPSGVKSMGYSNLPISELHTGWFYLPQGTATINVPPEEIVNEILQEIKDELYQITLE